ncbi:type II toxin-antitoxin system YoeB family toxin [Nitrosovibrio sp. Nv4]|nr:type II toxin-antitoxin system YoeB family toxin [Nitrosovibrio sp. Nv4]
MGEPEPLRESLVEFWSRRIDEVNRFVYELSDSDIAIISCRYHYG